MGEKSERLCGSGHKMMRNPKSSSQDGEDEE